MPVANVTTGDPITEAWGDSVADSVNDLEAVAPTANEKAALAGTSGAPAVGNKYVTDADPRNTNSRTPADHTHASAGAQGGSSLSPATLILPGAVGPTPTTEGQAQWDTTSSYIVVGTGAGTAYFFQVAGTPSTQDFGDAAAAGSASSTARSDHKHAMPANPVPAGASFPGSPSTNDRYFRTDRGIEYFYNGTRWLSVQLYTDPITRNRGGDQPLSSTASVADAWAAWGGLYDLWVESVITAFFVAAGTALSGSHKWVVTQIKQPSGTTIATVNIDSGASTTWRQITTAVGALFGTTDFIVQATYTKTGTPGNLSVQSRFLYRLVG